MSWLRRFRSAVLRSKLDEDFAEETQFHLDERVDEYVKGGMSYEEARREAHRAASRLLLTKGIEDGTGYAKIWRVCWCNTEIRSPAVRDKSITNQFLGSPDGQFPQQQRIYEGEDRGVGPDADGQGDDDNAREDRMHSHLSRAVAQVK